MRLRPWLAAALALVGCPSLDGFTGKDKGADAGPSGKGFLSFSDAAKLCSKIQTCPNLGYSVGYSLLLPVQVDSYSTCIDVLSSPLPYNQIGAAQRTQSLTCAVGATSCTAAAACMPFEVIDPGDPRCATGDGGIKEICAPDKTAIYYCDIQWVTHCNNPFFYPGATCLTDTTDAGTSGKHSCAVAESCSQEGKCEGSVLTFCNTSGFAYGLDCAFYGATCGWDDVAAWNDCVLNGAAPACATDAVSCVGDRVRTCYQKYFGEIDCVALGQKCDPWPGPHCVRPTDACKQTDPGINTCTGDSIELCVAGQRQSLDCTSVGLKCVPGPNTSYCG